MRWVNAWLQQCWRCYRDSYDLDTEIRENHPLICIAVCLAFVLCFILFWLVDAHFLLRDGLFLLCTGLLGCLCSMGSWIAWRMGARRVSYALQLVDSPLLGLAVLWAGISTINVLGIGFLFFWVVMTQKWARQYALNILSSVTILLPGGIVFLLCNHPAYHTIIAAGSMFFLITSYQTRTYVKLRYGSMRISQVLRILELICKKKIIQYYQFSEAMRKLREQIFVVRANAQWLEEHLIHEQQCDECRIIADLHQAARTMGETLSEPLQSIEDGESALFTMRELLDAVLVRRSIVLSLTHIDAEKLLTVDAQEFLLDSLLRGDIHVIALVIHSLIDNAWEAEALHVTLAVCMRDQCLQVRIADNGKGVPITVRHRIFEPSFSLRKHHAGMGLFFARQAMRFYGGDVRLEKTGEEGSVFCIDLCRLVANARSLQG